MELVVDNAIEPEFSRLFGVSVIPPGGRKIEVSATPEECAALSERYKIVSLLSLSADVRLLAVAGAGSGRVVKVAGTIRAEVEQVCGVTVTPFVARVEESFERFYATPATTAALATGDLIDELEIDPLADDPPDPIVDGRIDIGELVAEELALAIDPFPRLPGAEFVAPPELTPPANDLGPDRQLPFAALGDLTRGLKDK